MLKPIDTDTFHSPLHLVEGLGERSSQPADTFHSPSLVGRHKGEIDYLDRSGRGQSSLSRKPSPEAERISAKLNGVEGAGGERLFVAHFHSPFTSKFGIPKQSGLVEELRGTIVFAPEFRNPDYIRGIEGFDYLWLIWEFSANRHKASSPVVRPPVLGGNEKVGVFATRSPFRPNNIGLSSVRLLRVEWESPEGPVLHISGADLMDGTPILDIKPYIEYADSHVGVRSGFVDSNPIKRLRVVVSEEVEVGLRRHLTDDEFTSLIKTLELDPRPHYHHDPTKVYGMPFATLDIHFRVEGDVLTII